LYDEFYAEGIVALWQAYQKYLPEKGNIGTYLNYQIRFRLIDLLRKKIRYAEVVDEYVEKKKRTLNQGNYHRRPKIPLVDPYEIPLENEAFWKEVRKPLTEKQWKWVKYFIIADLTVQEIMEIEGVSADAVKGWGREVRRKLRNEPLWEWLM